MPTVIQTQQFTDEAQSLDRCTYEDACRFVGRTRTGTITGFLKHVQDTGQAAVITDDPKGTAQPIVAARNGNAHLFMAYDNRTGTITFLSVHADPDEPIVEAEVDTKVLNGFEPTPETPEEQA